MAIFTTFFIKLDPLASICKQPDPNKKLEIVLTYQANIEQSCNLETNKTKRKPKNWIRLTFKAIGVFSHSSGGIVSCAFCSSSRTDSAAPAGFSLKAESPGFTWTKKIYPYYDKYWGYIFCFHFWPIVTSFFPSISNIKGRKEYKDNTYIQGGCGKKKIQHTSI